jgi:hypothetical protein
MNEQRDLEEVYEEWIESLDRKIEKCDGEKRRKRLQVVRSEVLERLGNIRKYGTPSAPSDTPIGVNIRT